VYCCYVFCCSVVICAEEAYKGAAVSGAQRCTALEPVIISRRNVSLHGQVVVIAVAGTKYISDWVMNLKLGASDTKGLLVCGSGLQ
jgi:hypothetical protein